MHKFRWPPSQFLALSDEEQAFVIAAIMVRVETEKEQADKIKRK